MEQIVLKYPIRQPVEEFTVPNYHKVLSVIVQGNDIMVYVLIDKSKLARTEILRFHTLATGRATNVPVNSHFVGTAVLHGGKLVFHVFYDQRTQTEGEKV